MDLDKIKKEKPIKELLEFSIINLDKPNGPTSFEAIDILKKILGVKKVSHFGTLDPMVTGVLPTGLNRACKLSNWIMKKNKTYVGVMHLHEEISEELVKKEMEGFLGEIIQLPPVRSRVKRQERPRSVYKFEMIEKKGKDVLFLSEVEAGTYIRKLVHDLGLKIGGAHMTALRRTKAGLFSEEDKEFLNLYDLEKAVKDFENGDETRLREILIPGEIITKLMPVVQVREDSVKKLMDGSPILGNFLDSKPILKEKEFAAFCGDQFIGIYEVKNEREVFAKPKFVFN